MFKVGDRVIVVVDAAQRPRFYSAGNIGTMKDPATLLVAFDKGQKGLDPACDSTWFCTSRQLAMLDAAPTARATDPTTSKGQRKVNKYEQAVLDMLAKDKQDGFPSDLGMTGKEIAKHSGHPLNCITPRFAPLRRKGLIKDSGTKRDKQIVWMLA